MMPDERRITHWQYAVLLGGFLIGTSTLLVPVGPAQHSSWISQLAAAALGVPTVILWLRISEKFPRKLPAEYFVEAAGRPLGAALTIVYMWFCFHLGSTVVASFMEVYVAAVYSKTPEIIFDAGLVFLSFAAVYLGIETFARASEIVVPLAYLASASTVVASLMTKNLLDFRELLPIHGAAPILLTTWQAYAFPFGETIVFLSVLPYVTGGKHMLRASAAPVVIVGLLLTSVGVRNIAALGHIVERALFPSLMAVELVSVGDFIQRLDSVLLIVWTFSAFVKTTACLFAVVVNAAALFRVKDYRVLAFPFAALMTVAASGLTGRTVAMTEFARFVWPLYALPIELGIPLIVLGTASLRRRGRRKGAGSGKP